MREREERKVSRSEAIAVLSLIIFIICFQIFTFVINRYAESDDSFDLPPDNDFQDLSCGDYDGGGNGSGDGGGSYGNSGCAGDYGSGSCGSGYGSSGNGGRSVHGGSGGADDNRGSCRDMRTKESRSTAEDLSGRRKKEVKKGKPIISITRNNTPYGKQRGSQKVNLNTADSAALTSLYGIGPYFARKIIDYRNRLGGSFVSIFQLMEIYGMDSIRFNKIKNRIVIDKGVKMFSIRDAEFSFMRNNPYIGYKSAKRIIEYRNENGKNQCTLTNLLKLSILDSTQIELLRPYVYE